MSFEEAEVLRERARSFLRNARNLFDQGDYDLAAFNLQQFCQLIVKCKLLMKTGTYPRIHSLTTLLKILGKASERADTNEFVEKNILHLTKIEDAYITSRYLPRRIEKREIEELLTFVEKVFNEYVEKL